jgi:hypothetical protein
MLELGISQAQSRFAEILNQIVFVVDKKAQQKRAVIMPYDEYEKLIKRSSIKESLQDGYFNQFVGILDDSFSSDDERYQSIVK